MVMSLSGSAPAELQKERAALVEAFLVKTFQDGSIPARLAEAMRYSLLAGGKRLRPVLCLSCALSVAPDRAESLYQAVMPFAAALEMIHTYSLIHDDLPALDDDDLRRGKPTCHNAFDEATAILAGDGLLTDAFGFMAQTPLPSERVLAAMTLAANAAGASGMVGGQSLDLLAEGKTISLDELMLLNAKKTGALLRASCECGALLAGAERHVVKAFRLYGQELGIAFQITDDILDVVGDAAVMGKQAGSDAGHAKATWTGLIGLEAARERARAHCDAAQEILDPKLFSGQDVKLLRHIAGSLADRTF
jgi:geranylgeranyl diphosphate synthase type II